jgi:hypothetical protein
MMAKLSDNGLTALKKRIELALSSPDTSGEVMGFLDGIRKRADKYGTDIFLSEKEQAFLDRIFLSCGIPHPDAPEWATRKTEILSRRWG